MFKTEMFPHLMTLNPPNLVEIEQKQNKLQISIDNPLIYKKYMNNNLKLFMLVGSVLFLAHT